MKKRNKKKFSDFELLKKWFDKNNIPYGSGPSSEIKGGSCIVLTPKGSCLFWSDFYEDGKFCQGIVNFAGFKEFLKHLDAANGTLTVEFYKSEQLQSSKRKNAK